MLALCNTGTGGVTVISQRETTLGKRGTTALVLMASGCKVDFCRVFGVHFLAAGDGDDGGLTLSGAHVLLSRIANLSSHRSLVAFRLSDDLAPGDAALPQILPTMSRASFLELSRPIASQAIMCSSSRSTPSSQLRSPAR